MHQDWRELAEDLNPLVAALRSAQPDAMKGFSQMAQAALKTGALDTKTKELIALDISVAIRCAMHHLSRKGRSERWRHGR